jgi:hypothetical protein
LPTPTSALVFVDAALLTKKCAAPAAVFDPLTMDPGCNDGALKVPLEPKTLALG